MKLLLFVGVLVCAAANSGQQARDMSFEGTITRVLKTGDFWGQDTKVLARGCDAGAALLARILADRALSDEEIANVVATVDQCFYDPARVEKPSDREPRTALLLLKYLQYQTRSPEQKRIIEETRKTILDRYAAYEKREYAPPVGP